MTQYRPADPTQLRDIIAWAVSYEQPLEIIGGGSKQELGRPLQLDHRLDLSELHGIVDYEPAELVLTARAATPLADIDDILRQRGQMMAFEPPDWRRLLGGESGPPKTPTLGGILSCNLAGPRRFIAGAARDHVLGVSGVSGRGEIFKAGGKVVKNVTGYDLPKLIAGSWGTLVALTEITIKVLPRPDKIRTVLIFGLDERRASAAMAEALRMPYAVSGAAHLPASLAARSEVGAVATASAAVTALRLEGHAPSVVHRCARLRADLAAFGTVEELHSLASMEIWAEIADVASFDAKLPREKGRAVWRASLVPSRAPDFIARARENIDCACFLDWGGGLVWLSVPNDGDAGAATLRAALAESSRDGHLTLIRAPRSVRAAVPVFEPLAPPLAALTGRVKKSFDPKRILNRGRMYSGI